LGKVARPILIRVIVYGVLTGVAASALVAGFWIAGDLQWQHLRFTEWIERDENKQWWYGFTVANGGWRYEELRISIREMLSDTLHEVRSISMRLAPEQRENVKIEPDERWYAQVYAKRGGEFLLVETLSLRNAVVTESRLSQWKHYKDLEVLDRPNILLPLSPVGGFPIEVTTIMPRSGSSVDLTYHIWLPDEYFEYFGKEPGDSLTLRIDFYDYTMEILNAGGARVLNTGRKYPTLFYIMHKGSVDVLKVRVRVPRRFVRTAERNFVFYLEDQLPDGFSHHLSGLVVLENLPRFPFVKRWTGRVLTLIAPV
jgi:hypothetical protein